MAVLFVSEESEPVLTLCFEAVTAVHGTISAGLEGNLRLTSAAIADYGVHLPGSTAVAVLRAASRTAGRAAAGFILETFLGKEFLLTGRKNEFVAAITTGQSLVFVHGSNPPKNVVYPRHW